ncbi:flagellar basal body-associated protein FliL [Rosenbergiella sp. S61]|uniref:Flagellar protein FliL n=1 Tax=Rosenbergiella gaditana TaxID=2726987 RepID=A0ABS5STX3_9GAMM|nr:flagellar basal body-associated protein FliL [Rosenbergiella gaditana]MBT0722883.1 flagellar basal body-associated protein FliL [Rosenbergiella gaditana]
MSTKSESPHKSARKWIILLTVIALIACGAAGYAVWKLRALSTSPQTPTLTQVPEEITIPQPLFYPLEPFTVNLMASASQDERVLYIGFTLRLKDKQTEERLIKYLPAVRSRILLLLSHQEQTALQTEEGKTALSVQIKKVLKDPLAHGLPEQDIADILYTTFILR